MRSPVTFSGFFKASVLQQVLRTLAAATLLLTFSAAARSQLVPPTPARIVGKIDDSHLIRLAGNTHPALASAVDLGAVDPALPLEHLQLVLKRSPEQQAAYDAMTASLYDPKSPNFHHWLTPDQIGEQYGVADADIATLTAWLQRQGFTVNSVSRGRLVIDFSGTAAQVQQALHVQLHSFNVKGESHIANTADPQIPEALSPVVAGVLGLNNFFAKSQLIHKDPSQPHLQRLPAPAFPGASPLSNPQYDNPDTGDHDVSPFDFATIYNSLPLWQSGVDGSGVTVAIVARTDILLSDIELFQTTFGLPVHPPTVIHNGPDPGITDAGNQGENTLDVEWAGATAPGANIAIVVSASTNTADGSNLSQLYIIDNQIASIMSSSYGSCELSLGTSGNAFFNSLWQQAAAEGISSFVASGDQGSAGCDNSNAASPYAAASGLQVNGLASTPYNTAVGGTDFGLPSKSSPSTYWSSTNAANGQSALGYIPEVPWNNSCASTVVDALLGVPNQPAEETCNDIYQYNPQFDFLLVTVGGSGGVSACTTPSGTSPADCSGGYAKPSWQAGTGVPADGKRDLPDVSLFAAAGPIGNAYAYELNGSLGEVGGTSVASPAMAGVMALVDQKLGGAQGLANPVLYQLAATETLATCDSDTVTAGNTCIFYDTQTGNNAQPCLNGSPNCTVNPADPFGDAIGVLNGYNTTVGYDLATGLGSVNVTNLVNAWNSAVGPESVTLTLSPATFPAFYKGAAVSLNVTAAGGLAPYTYALTSGSLPPGTTLRNGLLSGVPTATGSYNFTIAAVDSAPAIHHSTSRTYTVTVNAATTPAAFSWYPSQDSSYSGLPLGVGVLDATSTNSGTIAYTAYVYGGLNGGVLSGATVSVTPSTILAPGSYALNATFTPSPSGAAQTLTIPYTVLAEHIWVANSNNTVSALDAGGNVFATALAGGDNSIAVDQVGEVYSLNAQSLALFASSGVSYGNGATGGGLNTPASIAIDGNRRSWVANGNGSVSEFAPNAEPYSPTGGYTTNSITAHAGLSLDISGNVWLTNPANNSVTELLGAAAPATPLAKAITLGEAAAKP